MRAVLTSSSIAMTSDAADPEVLIVLHIIQRTVARHRHLAAPSIHGGRQHAPTSGMFVIKHRLTIS
eukprot:28649-Eustigmatos_ZCMA.PRE.1